MEKNQKIMVCPQARDSKEVEKSAELVIDISHDEDQQIKEHKKDTKKEKYDWQDYCIYRVPKQLRKVNEEAYTPKLVSIGPFHHNKSDLKDMEKHKQKYLDDFLERTNRNSLADLQKTIEDNKEEIRSCYSEKCGFESGTDFVEMILLDAVFIIELFLKDQERKESDYILSKPWLRDGIQHDLILLENQLPFFILVKLYMFAKDQQSKEHEEDLPKKRTGCEDTQFVKLCCNYSGCLSHHQECQQIKEHEEHQERQQIKEHEEDLLKKEATRRFVELSRNYFRRYDKEPESIVKEPESITDLLRYLFCPSPKEQEEESSCTRFWLSCPRKMEQLWKNKVGKRRSKESSDNILYCATKLDNAGLKFKEVKDGRRLLDIRPPQPSVFRCFPCFGRPMEVPQLVINDYTETLLRNLMALEQCHYPFEAYICNYVVLLDYLIDTEKDVDLLVNKKVIDYQLGSNDTVAKLINKLGEQIAVSKSTYFKNIAQEVNEYYEYPLNPTMATLKREYFPNIFRGTATVVGLIVLFFTFWSFLKPFVE